MASKKVLLYGEHPFTFSGNGNMFSGIMRQFDQCEDFDFAFLYVGEVDPNSYNIFTKQPFNFIPARLGNDHWGMGHLEAILSSQDFDILLTIGVDIWRFLPIIKGINKIKSAKKFTWVALFPYDSPFLIQDWVDCLSVVDVPLVYSQFGYDILKPVLPKVEYFRPPFYAPEKFKVISDEEMKVFWNVNFPHINKDKSFLFGFVGNNQMRKEPHKIVWAFSRVRNYFKGKIDVQLYMHTNMYPENGGIYNLIHLGGLAGLDSHCVTAKNPTKRYPISNMPLLYNCLDCLVIPSLSEGLSWTVLESMLCGTPVLASDSTAHKELVPEGWRVPVKETTMLPVPTSFQNSMLPFDSVSIDDLSQYMVHAVEDYLAGNQEKKSKKAVEISQEWLSGINNMKDVLSRKGIASEIVIQSKNDTDILFVQHSSAGDVLMSSQCFKGLKERHPGKRLVYMTQKQYQDIVTNNPYVDEVVDYDEKKIREYSLVYNPHGERILPGGFNNLDDKLYSLYPYFCKVEPDKMFIDLVAPGFDLPEEYIVVHTTGGQAYYRTYKNMQYVINDLPYPVVQIGGASDHYCEGALDYRGLSFRENAFIMSKALAAVVVDSFPSHLAGAVGVPVIVLYGPAPARVVGPRADESIVVNVEPNKLEVCPNLTSCWGHSGQNICQSPCINTINPMQIRDALLDLIKEVKK